MHRACICNPRDLAIEEFVEFLIIYAQKDQSIDFRQYQILYICIVIAFVCPPENEYYSSSLDRKSVV